jgi:RimJ/RimL family protein N-acetyltransferase
VSATLADVAWPVRTPRLLIRRATPDDAALTWPYRSDPATAEWLTRLPTDRAAYDAWYASSEVLDSTLIVDHGGQVVGDLYLQVKDGWAQKELTEHAAGTEAEIGWVLVPAARGHGLATEAVAELLRICFEDLGLRRVTAGCFAANEASWRLMERLGMRREAHTSGDALHRTHGWIDGMQYGILEPEWRRLHPR